MSHKVQVNIIILFPFSENVFRTLKKLQRVLQGEKTAVKWFMTENFKLDVPRKKFVEHTALLSLTASTNWLFQTEKGKPNLFCEQIRKIHQTNKPHEARARIVSFCFREFFFKFPLNTRVFGDVCANNILLFLSFFSMYCNAFAGWRKFVLPHYSSLHQTIKKLPPSVLPFSRNFKCDNNTKRERNNKM